MANFNHQIKSVQTVRGAAILREQEEYIAKRQNDQLKKNKDYRQEQENQQWLDQQHGKAVDNFTCIKKVVRKTLSMDTLHWLTGSRPK